MDLNPGQWTLCHNLKCKSLKGMLCTGECPYKSEGEKYKAFRAQRRNFFDAVQEEQNAPRLAMEKAKADELKAKKGGRS